LRFTKYSHQLWGTALRTTEFEESSVNTGEEMYRLMERLYPICRSITGGGVRESLKILQEYIPLTVHSVPTGTPVFDWNIPKEWNIRDAYIKNSNGERIVDFRRCNLHVINYSMPIKEKVSLSVLKNHTFTIPERPEWIPYRTSYYKENWGFCLTDRQLQELSEDEYEVCIDASLEDGHLNYGEYFLPGDTDAEILVSTHICHPSLANDNLSGMALAVSLARTLRSEPGRYSYRFLFTPGCIGSIAWLSLNEERLGNIKHGLILANVGDSGQITYKKSRRGDAEVDLAVSQVLKDSGEAHRLREFSPYGYDERQFCSPGINLPVGCFMRTPHGEFPEYHTSADNLELVKPEYLRDSFEKCVAILEVLENNRTYINQNPKCEPQLGKRGLYGSVGGSTEGRSGELAMLWLLNYSDGSNSLLDVAAKSGLNFTALKQAADRLSEHGLLAIGK
jgi:aminopeptidase-like protein